MNARPQQENREGREASEEKREEFLGAIKTENCTKFL
jgi:hypothetical protein